MRRLRGCLGAAVFALLALSACGATTRRDDSSNAGNSGTSGGGDARAGAPAEGDGDPPASGAGGKTSEPGAGGEPVGTGATSGGDAAVQRPLSGQAELCSGYLALWQRRQNERQPGEPTPPDGSAAPCFECFRAQELSCGLPAGACEPSTACVLRHCLCTREQPLSSSCNADDYPVDLCACIQSCLPQGPSDCENRWQKYLTCAVSACAVACE